MDEEKKVETPQTRDERIAELLKGSASDAVGAMKGPSLSDLAQPETKVEDKEPVEDEETPSGGKKVRIPASRLKTLTSKIEELEARLQDNQSYQERIANLESQLNNKGEEELPDWWKASYGEDENSKQGYKNQQRIMREELQRAIAEREAERQSQEAEREERISSIEQSFDAQMDELEDSLGRELTASQKSEILDVVGEYSPQEEGKYTAYMSIEKAYDIWQKSQGIDTGKKEMARIAGVQSSGGTSSGTSTERPQWGDWRKRFGG